MHIPITRKNRSIVDEALVHCHRGWEFELRHFNLFFVCVFLCLINLFMNLFKDIIHNNFQTTWVAEYRFNDSK